MKKKHLALACTILWFMGGYSQDGTPDASFGTNGIVETDFNNDWDDGKLIAATPSGNMYVTAYASALTPNTSLIISYLPNGTVNTAFGTNGVWNDANYQNNYDRIKNWGENLLVLTRNATNDYILLKLLSSGSLDSSFGINGELVVANTDQTATDFLVLPDNNLLVLLRQTNGGSSQIVLKRYLSDGSVDTAFGTNGEALIQLTNEINNPVLMNRDINGDIFVSG